MALLRPVVRRNQFSHYQCLSCATEDGASPLAPGEGDPKTHWPPPPAVQIFREIWELPVYHFCPPNHSSDYYFLCSPPPSLLPHTKWSGLLPTVSPYCWLAGPSCCWSEYPLTRALLLMQCQLPSVFGKALSSGKGRADKSPWGLHRIPLMAAGRGLGLMQSSQVKHSSLAQGQKPLSVATYSSRGYLHAHKPNTSGRTWISLN